MKKRIREFISKETFTDQNKIDDDTLLFDEGIFDSMGLLNLISFLEEDFGVKVQDFELDAANFGSIDAISSYLEKKLN